MCLSLGSLRCRYRHSWSEPAPLGRDEAEEIILQMGQTAYVFAAGTRLGLMIASSDFPRILPHPNTMAPTWSEAEPMAARNGVLHGPGTLSRLKLPVLEL